MYNKNFFLFHIVNWRIDFCLLISVDLKNYINIAFDIAIPKVTFNVNWGPLILSAVDRLEKLISTQRRDPELNPDSLRWKRACYRSATVARSSNYCACTIYFHIYVVALMHSSLWYYLASKFCCFNMIVNQCSTYIRPTLSMSWQLQALNLQAANHHSTVSFINCYFAELKS